MLGSNRKGPYLYLRHSPLTYAKQNGGHCQPETYSSSPSIAKFHIRNYEAIESLIAKDNISCDWRSLPACDAYMNSDMFTIAVSKVQNMKTTSPELASLVQVITKDSTNPSLSDLRLPNVEGAIIQVKAASLWPYKFVAPILEDLITDGFINLQTSTPVTSLQKINGGDWIANTPEGAISSPTVLLCTNAYTSALVPGFNDLIVPGKNISSERP